LLKSALESCKFNTIACKSDIKHKFIAVQIPVHMWHAMKSLKP